MTSYIDEKGNPLVIQMNDLKNYEILESPLRLSEVSNPSNICKLQDGWELKEVIDEHRHYAQLPEYEIDARMRNQMEDEFWAHVYEITPQSVDCRFSSRTRFRINKT